MAFLRTVLRCSVQRKYGFNFEQIARSISDKGTQSTALKSTAAVMPGTTSTAGTCNMGPRDPLDITFEDARAAFKSKTTWELVRAYIVYTLCSFETLVEHNMKIMKLMRAVMGERLFIWLMKGTFYGHFVAGEDQYKIRPCLERLRSFGVKPILDYSVEEDLSQEEAEKREVEALQAEGG